jgi:translation initiation factor 3 subunit C
MSRFFANVQAEDESEGSDEEHEVLPTQETAGPQRGGGPRGGPADADMQLFESSSSDEEKRVIRSAKTKRFEALNSSVRTLNNLMKVNDFAKIKTELDTLIKQVDKSKKIIDAEGYPKFFLKFVIQLEEYTNDTFAKKGDLKLNKQSVNQLNVVRQKIKKYNQDLKKVLDAYKANPVDDEDEEDGGAADGAKGGDESGDEDQKGDDDDDDDDLDDLDLNSKNVFSRDFWVKKEVLAARRANAGKVEEDVKVEDMDLGSDDEEDDETKVDADAGDDVKTGKAGKKKKPMYGDDEEDDGFEVVGAKGKQKAKTEEINWTPQLIEAKLKEILAARGKKNIDRTQVIQDLQLLVEKSMNEIVLLKSKISLLSAYFDLNLNKAGIMTVEHWKKAAELLMDIVMASATNPKIRLSEEADVEEFSMMKEELKEVKEANDQPVVAPAPVVPVPEPEFYTVAGNLSSFLVRLADELTKALMETDLHTEEYTERLACELQLLKLAARIQAHYKKNGNSDKECLVALFRAEILYCKYQPNFDALAFPEEKASSDRVASLFHLEKSVFHNLCRLLFVQADARTKTRTTILLVYNYALHNHYHKSREVFLMSHIQDHIAQTDVSTQILYNRAIAQFGLCAFRCGYYREALQSMTDLHANAKVKEMLAQGVSNKYDVEDDFVKFERSNQIPDHLHLAPDLLDAVHVLSGMILEVPHIAANDRRHVVSRNFRRLWENYNKQTLNGPPETTRDCAMAASRALSHGYWRKALDFVYRMKFWSLIGRYPEIVKASLENAMKEVALRTFLIRYGRQYVAISLEKLVRMFQLDATKVHSIVSRMMIKEELEGAWDQTTNCIVMYSTQPNSLQQCALQFADKVSALVEQNEKMVEQKGGATYREKSGYRKTAKKVAAKGGASKGKKPTKAR